MRENPLRLNPFCSWKTKGGGLHTPVQRIPPRSNRRRTASRCGASSEFAGRTPGTCSSVEIPRRSSASRTSRRFGRTVLAWFCFFGRRSHVRRGAERTKEGGYGAPTVTSTHPRAPGWDEANHPGPPFDSRLLFLVQSTERPPQGPLPPDPRRTS